MGSFWRFRVVLLLVLLPGMAVAIWELLLSERRMRVIAIGVHDGAKEGRAHVSWYKGEYGVRDGGRIDFKAMEASAPTPEGVGWDMLLSSIQFDGRRYADLGYSFVIGGVPVIQVDVRECASRSEEQRAVGVAWLRQLAGRDFSLPEAALRALSDSEVELASKALSELYVMDVGSWTKDELGGLVIIASLVARECILDMSGAIVMHALKNAPDRMSRVLSRAVVQLRNANLRSNYSNGCNIIEYVTKRMVASNDVAGG